MRRRIGYILILTTVLVLLCGLPASLAFGGTYSGSPNASVTVTATPAFHLPPTVTADPIQIPADGTSTTTITATANEDSTPVVDGTPVRFTTNHGFFSNDAQTVDKTTVGGVATAELKSVESTETVIATVVAEVNGSKGATSAFFIAPDEPEVSDREVEMTSPGEDTVDAISTTDTEVTKSGDGTPVVTVAKYTSNPGGAAPGGFAAADAYIDVHLDRTEDVGQILIKQYYTAAQVAGLDESSLRMSWWNGALWVLCSLSSVNTDDGDGYSGYVQATITASTTPNLTDLKGAMFNCVGASLPAGGGGGGGGGLAPPTVRVLTLDTLGKIMQVKVKLDGTLLESFVIAAPEGNVSLGVDSGTNIICSNDKVPQRLEMRLYEEPLPVPEGFATVSPVYDFTAYTDDGAPQPVTFDPAIRLLISYDPDELPENTTSVFIAYYDEELGWTHLEPPTGFVAEAGTAAAQVNHFTSFAVMANVAAPVLPALFELRDLNISPLAVKTGESITISAWLSNIGGLRGEHTVIVNMKGLLETSQTIGLAPGQSQKLTFTLTPGSPGSYIVALDDLKASFVVEAVPVPPTPEPVEPGGYGWIIAIVSAVVVLAALATVTARKRLQPALAVEAGVQRWLMPSVSAGAAVADLTFTAARERLQPAPAGTANIFRRLVPGWLLPISSALAAVTALTFTATKVRLLRTPAAIANIYRWLVPGWLIPTGSALAAATALTFNATKERLLRAPAAIANIYRWLVPGWLIPIFSALAAVTALTFTATKVRLLRTPAAIANIYRWLVPGWLIPIFSALAAVTALTFTAAKERLQRAPAAIANIYRWLVPGWLLPTCSALAAVTALIFTATRVRLQRAPAAIANIYRWLVPGWLLPTGPALAAATALIFNATKVRLQRTPVGMANIYRWLVPGWLLPTCSALAAATALIFTATKVRLQRALGAEKPAPAPFHFANVKAAAASAFTSTRERLQPAPAAAVKPAPFRFGNMTAAAASAFTSTRERLQPAPAPEKPAPAPFHFANVKAAAASAFTSTRERLQPAPAAAVKPAPFRFANVKAAAASAFTSTRERLQPAPAAAVKPAPFRFGNVAAAAASAFTSTRERLQWAPAAAVKPTPFRFGNMAAAAASAFTSTRERLQWAPAVTVKPAPFHFANMAAAAASAFTSTRERLQPAPAPAVKPAPFRFANVAEVAASAFTSTRERWQWPLAPEKPAPLRVNNLRITPKRAKLGKKVTIMAEASNLSADVSNYSLVLRIKGRVEAVKEITLEPDQSQKVAFTILKDRPGTYSVELEESKGSFRVEP